MKLDTLYTERLILRQFSKEDLEDYTTIMIKPSGHLLLWHWKRENSGRCPSGTDSFSELS